VEREGGEGKRKGGGGESRGLALEKGVGGTRVMEKGRAFQLQVKRCKRPSAWRGKRRNGDRVI